MPMQRFHAALNATIIDGWFAKESITLLAPDGQANVIASSEPLDPDMNTEAYAAIQGDLLRTEFPEYKEFAFEAIKVFGGLDGFVRRFEWTPPDGEPVTQMQMYVVEERRGYTATATTPSSEFQRYEPKLRLILRELTFGRGPSSLPSSVK